MTDPAPLREAIARKIDGMKVDATVDGAYYDTIILRDDAAKQITDAVMDTLAALPTDAVQPVGGVDREAIARVIDPSSFSDQFFAHKDRVATALAKADAILALYATAPTAGSGCPDLHAIAKDAAERVHKNGGCVPQLAYAPILWALQDALYATAPTAGSGWLPIESAPKDGTVFEARCGDYKPFSCEWDGKRFIHYDAEDGPINYRPDQWRPAAPTVGGE